MVFDTKHAKAAFVVGDRVQFTARDKKRHQLSLAGCYFRLKIFFSFGNIRPCRAVMHFRTGHSDRQ
jgi:hypothetical protein